MSFAATPEPPYLAVIFTSRATDDREGYAATAAEMTRLALATEGCLGAESTSDGRTGITVSYWRDEDAIRRWRDDLEHRAARNEGRARWYDGYELRVARVERAYGWRRGED